ncbi:MAG: hypothetical protein ABL921_26430 [Pirellula sp.]
MTTFSFEMKLVKEISRRDILLSMARLPHSDQVMVGSSDFSLYGFLLSSDKKDPTFQGKAHESYVTGVAVSGQSVVTGGFDCRLVWWPIDGAQPQHAIVAAHQRFIRDVQASPDGKFIASVGDDMMARIWDSQTHALLHEMRGHAITTPHHYPSMLYACAISPDNQHLATVDRVGKIIVWQMSDGSKVIELESPEMYTWDPKQRRHSIGGIRSVMFSPNGQFLAVGGMGQVGNIDHLEGKARVEIFDWKKGEKTHTYSDCAFKGLVESIAFHPSGNWLVAAGGDQNGFMMFFDITDPKKSLRDEKAPMHIHDIQFNETGDALYAVGHGRLTKWSVSLVLSPD